MPDKPNFPFPLGEPIDPAANDPRPLYAALFREGELVAVFGDELPICVVLSDNPTYRLGDAWEISQETWRFLRRGFDPFWRNAPVHLNDRTPDEVDDFTAWAEWFAEALPATHPAVGVYDVESWGF